MMLLIAVILTGDLWHYEVTMAPEDLEALYGYPETETTYPAHISCPSGECDCMVGFRGSTSLELPKKSWRMELFDEGMIGRCELLLDAHYRDLSMMRNHLAMELVRRMGYPAPMTRHVTLSINGSNMGVYLETERVDDDFLARNGLPDGAVFKAVGSQARLVPFLSGHPPDDGFECRSGDEYGIPELVRLIGDVCRGGEYEGRFEVESFVGNMAANLAIFDMDCCVKNYFLILGVDGVWRYYPWDHDASFGNDWRGLFDFARVEAVYYQPMYMNSLFPRALAECSHREQFGQDLERAADILENELPMSLDSIRNSIRADVYQDPLRQGTPADFESACDSLRLFITERSAVVRELSVHHNPPEFTSLSIEPGWVTPDDRILAVNFSSSDSLAWCTLYVVPDNDDPEELEMHQVQGSGGREWTAGIAALAAFEESMRFLVYYRQANLPEPTPTIYYPSYGIYGNTYGNEALPSVVRVDAEPEVEMLLPGTQIRLGPSLWALPMVNESCTTMDLSLCQAVLGDPPYSVFFPDSLLLAPGETLFVTNDLDAFSLTLSGRKAAGDCAAPSVSSSVVMICDPSWTPATTHLVPPGERLLRIGNCIPLLTELCYSQPQCAGSGDWIELHNPDGRWLDLSLTGISDSGEGFTVLPAGTGIPPGGYLILASSPQSFLLAHPRLQCGVTALGFDLSAEGETLRFISRTGSTSNLLTFGSELPWADASDAVLSLIGPDKDPKNAESWEVVMYPGTPGSPNASWDLHVSEPLELRCIHPVPAGHDRVYFSVSAVDSPVSALLVDLAGRVVHDIGMLEPGVEEYSLEPPPGLPSGVYFLVVSSAGDTSAGRMIWLR